MKKYRFFGSFLETQEKWLNKMSSQGYRLVRTGKMLYEFESCSPNAVQYCVEFIGEKSRSNAEDYRCFLEDLGYKVFYKNINLNYSIGKIRVRPWAEKGGRIATNGTTYNRELLIIEKENDGKPFEIHTSLGDRIRYYRKLRNPWIFFLVIFGAMGIFLQSIVSGVFAALTLFPIVIYQLKIAKINKELDYREE